jgi:GST-like protein
MIDLYTWSTPNGRKVTIMLEEVSLPYRVHPIHIGKGEQHDSEFLKISPNNKIPAIVDGDNGLAMMESGAILLYLAEKTGKLGPTGDAEHWEMLQWLMFQMASVGPMLGQTHHFLRNRKGEDAYACERYLKENRRIYGVLDARLADRDYIVGDYSIVDIATWPWIARFDWQTMDLDNYPNVKRWYLSIVERQAVQHGWNIPESDQKIPMP